MLAEEGGCLGYRERKVEIQVVIEMDVIKVSKMDALYRNISLDFF